MKRIYSHIGAASLLTRKTDTIDSLNAYLSSVGSRQTVQRRAYKRMWRLELVHWTDQGKFTDAIFDLGDKVQFRTSEGIFSELAR